MLAVTPPGPGEPGAALLHDGSCHTGPVAQVVEAAARLEAAASPRWVWWSAESAATPLVDAGVPVARAWDVAEAHRLLHGGWSATAGQCWAAAHGIPVEDVPAPPTGDLFEFAANTPPIGADTLVDAAGHLRGDHEEWLRDPAHLRRVGAGGARHGAPAARRGRGRLGAPGRHGAVRVGGRGAVPRAAPRRAADRPGAHRAAARRRGRPAARRPTPRSWPPGAPATRSVLRHVPGPGVDRPAQPGAGARAAQRRGGRRAEHPQVGARALPHGAPAGGRPARLAPRRADRHDLRVPLARRARRPRRPAARAAGPPATAPPGG